MVQDSLKALSLNPRYAYLNESLLESKSHVNVYDVCRSIHEGPSESPLICVSYIQQYPEASRIEEALIFLEWLTLIQAEAGNNFMTSLVKVWKYQQNTRML